jgi:predicted transcriptional regulator YdeE/DNA-binding transcriptional MerR regulator
MLKIGDFSRIAQVTVKALRHYAEMGLLTPAWIDRFTGYRYYSLDQLPRLNRILALKDLGFSLEQIGRLIDDNLTAEQLRGFVLMKQAELKMRIQEEQVRLARVEARLAQIDQEGSQPGYEVVLKTVPAQWAAGIREVVPEAGSLAARRAALHAEVQAWLSNSDERLPGPWLEMLDNPEHIIRNIPLTVARLLNGPAPSRPTGRIQVSRLPQIEAASLVHAGGPETLTQAYAAFYQWGEMNGYRVCGPARELHYSEDMADEVQLIELQFPVEKIELPRNRHNINQAQVEDSMEPKFVTKPAFLVAGTRYQGKNANQEIAVMWDQDFLPRIHEIKRVDPYVSYGVCIMEPGMPEGEFAYIAGCEVADPADTPDGMTVFEVPEQEYAVFAHRGRAEEIPATYEYVHQVWLPNSGYRRVNGPDMEVYTNEFHGFEEGSVLYIYIPVEKV